MLKLLLIALLAIVAYLPTLSQPFIEDDYPIISLSRSYGPISGWRTMVHDDVNRVRATTFILTHGIEGLFGLHARAFYSVSILLHVFNCWLIYALGRWNVIGYRVSQWSAAFFAIYEGHQEAVMWYAAANELLLFLFVALTLLCWSLFLERKAWRWYIASFACFALALVSKESSLVVVPLLMLPLVLGNREPWDSENRIGPPLLRQALLFVLPFVVIGAVYAFMIFETREHSFRFQDQSFVLSAPFWETWLKSFFGLLLPWGWLSIVALFFWRQHARLLMLALVWISITLVPYMFVDYVHSIPSRQTYMASMGLTLVVGATIATLRHERFPNWVFSLVLMIMLVHNVGYLWLVKRKQFLDRARPTEQLLSVIRDAKGPVFVRCFPRPPIIANAAVEVMLAKPQGTLLWSEADARDKSAVTSFCYEQH